MNDLERKKILLHYTDGRRVRLKEVNNLSKVVRTILDPKTVLSSILHHFLFMMTAYSKPPFLQNIKLKNLHSIQIQ